MFCKVFNLILSTYIIAKGVFLDDYGCSLLGTLTISGNI